MAWKYSKILFKGRRSSHLLNKLIWIFIAALMWSSAAALEDLDGATHFLLGDVLTDLEVVRRTSNTGITNCGAGWQLLRSTPSRPGIDLNQGGLPVGQNDADSEPAFDLCYKSAFFPTVSEAISAVYVTTTSNCVPGFTKIDQNINEGADRLRENYICYHKSNNLVTWLTGIMIKSDNALEGSGWQQVGEVFNLYFGGDGTNIPLAMFNMQLAARNQAFWDCGGEEETPCTADSGFSGGVGVINICDRGLRSVGEECVNGLAPRSRYRPAVDNYLASLAGIAATWAINNQRDQLQVREPLNWSSQIAAHNAYNNTSDGYTAPNQPFSITDQLRLGIRIFLIDLHWAGNAVRLSHGVPSPKDRLFQSLVKELAFWLDQPGNEDDVIIVYTEDSIPNGPDVDYLVNEPIRTFLANKTLMIGPRGNLDCNAGSDTCNRWPTRQEVLAHGKNIIFVTQDTNKYHAHNFEFIRPAILSQDYRPSELTIEDSLTDCFDYDRVRTHDYFYHRIEDEFGGLLDHLNNEEIGTLTTCNHPMISLNNITTNGKFDSIVWSWIPIRHDHNSYARFAFSLGGWTSTPTPHDLHHFACATPVVDEALDRPSGDQLGYAKDQVWKVTTQKGAWSDGFAACEEEYGAQGLVFSVPVNGSQNRNLIIDFVTSGLPISDQVWLNYRKLAGDRWLPQNRVNGLLETGFEN